jgi:hypothetical protein
MKAATHLVPAAMFLASVAFAAPARAQSFDAAALRVKPGGVITVWDSSGHKTQGTLDTFTPTSVKLRSPVSVEIPASQIARIDKEGDPLWDGALKGAAIGILPSVLAVEMSCGQAYYGNGPNTRTYCEGCPSSRAACGALGVAVFALLGVAVDRHHVGSTTIYRAPGANPVTIRLSPVVAPGRKALLLRVSF